MTETILVTMLSGALVGGFIAFCINEQRRRARIWAADCVWWRERARACRRQAVVMANRATELKGGPADLLGILDSYISQEDAAADRADRFANRAALRIPHRLREKFIEQARSDSEAQ